MQPATASRRLIPLSACLTGLLTLIAGCGDGTGLPKRYPVSGTVTYNNEPVESGTITFMPDDVAAGRSASGVIEDGDYYLTTAVDGDGALPGSYKVTITAKDELDMSQAEANIQGGSLRQDDVAAAITAAKDMVPPKYSLPDTSGLTYEVTESSNRNVDFDLTD